ncbi:hypothetical protein CDAR_484901 [Caerostris darwini]|uniref:Uncharacterized protein n=1 Tax=Caerostris darwini TaxID=1538125 RepID=A0AAV4PA11_9ARAC|nr:hypothetical protein CDAR_484901 [Caerostris darwini]
MTDITSSICRSTYLKLKEYFSHYSILMQYTELHYFEITRHYIRTGSHSGAAINPTYLISIPSVVTIESHCYDHSTTHPSATGQCPHLSKPLSFPICFNPATTGHD